MWRIVVLISSLLLSCSIIAAQGGMDDIEFNFDNLPEHDFQFDNHNVKFWESKEFEDELRKEFQDKFDLLDRDKDGKLTESQAATLLEVEAAEDQEEVEEFLAHSRLNHKEFTMDDLIHHLRDYIRHHAEGYDELEEQMRQQEAMNQAGEEIF